jgi:DNA polymerase
MGVPIDIETQVEVEDETVKEARIWLPNGLYLRYPQLRKQEKDVVYSYRKGKAILTKRLYGPKMVENLVQALARIVVFNQMLAISRKYRVVLTVHDEVVCLAREEEAADATAFMTDIMSRPPRWATGLPVACEVGVGDRYGEAK